MYHDLPDLRARTFASFWREGHGGDADMNDGQSATVKAVVFSFHLNEPSAIGFHVAFQRPCSGSPPHGHSRPWFQAL